MKKLLPILTLLFCLPLMPRVGAQDAAQVYSEYTRLSSVLQSSAAMSDRYEEAHRGLLQLFPQLHACAVRYTQQGDADNALAFAEAYVNMALMPQFEDNYLTRGERFPQMAYFTAYYYYNHRDYARAAQYLEVYLSSGTSANRMAVFNYLIMAYEYRGLYDKAEEVALWGLREYPTDAGLLNRLADCQLRTGRYTEAMQNIDMALQLHPNTPQLLESKGRCLEAMKQYREAADIFGALAEKKHTLSIFADTDTTSIPPPSSCTTTRCSTAVWSTSTRPCLCWRESWRPIPSRRST